MSLAIGVAYAYNPLASGESAPVAEAVFGQPDFTSSSSGAGLSNFFEPKDVCFDSFGVMYVSDNVNDRVLVFRDQTDTLADTVVGSVPNGVSAARLNGPTNLAVWDGPETSVLFVADIANHRVLAYITRSPAFGGVFFPDTIADYVFGQPNFDTNRQNNNGSGGIAVSANGFFFPSGISVLDTGAASIALFVADPGTNHRVLRFDIPKTSIGSPASFLDTTADAVWGQPNFTTSGFGTTAFNLNNPVDVIAAPDRLYILEQTNRRLVVESFLDGDTVFDAVYGQPGFTTSTSRSDSSGFSMPSVIAFTPSRGHLAISDLNLDRVLIHSDTTGADTMPEYVIGDTDFFAFPVSTTTGSTVIEPAGLFFRSDTVLFVVCRGQHRVLRFDGTIPLLTAETALPVSHIVSAAVRTTTNAPRNSTETYVQIHFSGGGTTPTPTSSSDSLGTGAQYSETTTLLHADDTAAIHIWTNQSSIRLFPGLRTDTQSLHAAGLPPGITNDDTGRTAFGRSIMLVEFADSTSRVLGDSVSTLYVGDSIAYTLRYFLSETTVALYRGLGFDTAPGSRSFAFYYADTYGGRWIQDSSTTIVVTAAAAPWNLCVTVYGITKDLPGGLGGAAMGSGGSAAGGGTCVLAQAGLPSPILSWLRRLRDYLLSTCIGRLLAEIYYLGV